MSDNYGYYDLTPLKEAIVRVRSEEYSVQLTKEEAEILEKLHETDCGSYSEIVGKALRVYQRLREFVGE